MNNFYATKANIFLNRYSIQGPIKIEHFWSIKDQNDKLIIQYGQIGGNNRMFLFSAFVCDKTSWQNFIIRPIRIEYCKTGKIEIKNRDQAIITITSHLLTFQHNRLTSRSFGVIQVHLQSRSSIDVDWQWYMMHFLSKYIHK